MNAASDTLQAAQSVDLLGLATNVSIFFVFAVTAVAGVIKGLKKVRSEPEVTHEPRHNPVDHRVISELIKVLSVTNVELVRATEALYSHRNASADKLTELSHQMERLRDKL